MPLSARQHFNLSHDQIAGRNNLFVEIMQGPNPCSPGEIDRLIARNPSRYSFFAGFGTASLKKAGKPIPFIRPVPGGWEVSGVDALVPDETTARRLAFGWPTAENLKLRADVGTPRSRTTDRPLYADVHQGQNLIGETS